jgi:glycosyltransferase involved in cell wall biosynthesis
MGVDMAQLNSSITGSGAGSPRPRWLLLCTHVPGSGVGGGMIRYAVELARALAGRPEVELHVLALAASREFFAGLLGAPDRVHTIPDGLPVVASSVLERYAGVAALRRRWDVVHGCKHILPWRSSALRVLTVHDMLLLDRPRDFPRLKRTFLGRPYLASIHDADTLVCVSAATRARLLAYAPEVESRVRVVPHAVSASLHRVPPEPVQALGGRRFALVVGDPSPRKNLRFLLDLWPHVVATHPDTALAVVGPAGWGISDLAANPDTAARRGIALLGHLHESQLRWCYSNATVVLCPSRHEGFGLPALEALEFGATVVTSTDPALVEVSGERAQHVAADDVAGWVEAIREALDGRPVGDAGRSADRRTWDCVAAETVRAVLGRA